MSPAADTRAAGAPAAPLLAQTVIAAKRDGARLSAAQIGAFVRGLVDDGPARWSDAQAAALAMAVLLRGMDAAETVALTTSMTHSGRVLDWSAAALPGPVLDKHSTGGVGDKTSLLIAPLVAACGGVVPMLSGRGLAHTGGTLDKLEALPGYRIDAGADDIAALLRDPRCGCAIVGASADLAPADRRLYAVRDTTATVESLPLITASILSKKLAAGLQALVLDVKVGSGAFLRDGAAARALAVSLVQVAQGAGLPAAALVTDMDQVLGRSAGNALEVAEALAALADRRGTDARLVEVTTALSARLLVLGGLQPDQAAARAALHAAWDRGEAAERFARLVAARGGPRGDVHALAATLPRATRVVPVPAPRAGVVTAVDVQALGWALVAAGAGRRVPADRIDPRVGLTDVAAPGRHLSAGEPLALLHLGASSDAAVASLQASLQAAFVLGDAEGPGAATAAPGTPEPAGPVVREVVTG